MKNRLRVLRAERRMTQKELARKLGVSRQTVLFIENDRNDPSLSVAFALARAFDTTIEAIFEHASAGRPAEHAFADCPVPARRAPLRAS